MCLKNTESNASALETSGKQSLKGYPNFIETTLFTNKLVDLPEEILIESRSLAIGSIELL